MTKKQERHIVATIGTILFLVLLFLLLWYMRLSTIVPEDEGVEITFADVEEIIDEEPAAEASAYAEEPTEAAPAAPASPAVEVAKSPTPSSPPEHIMSEEETLAMERARKEKEEREAAERARKQKEAEAIANAAKFGGLFGKTDGTNTEGNGASENPIKSGNSGNRDGRIKGLDGRNTRDGKLPTPTCDFQHDGVVVVQIRIDKDGNVISAVNAAGTNTSDNAMIQCAIEAIKNTKWTAGDGDAIGTITYKFIPT